MSGGRVRELQLDGLVGPTHNYAGLSVGNLASTANGGEASNPRAAALQGLAKMGFVRGLGVPQGVLPPHARPSLRFLRSVGFRGADEHVLAEAARVDGGAFLRLASSASAMWTANAATVAPSCDATDARVHFVPANLARMCHRAIEPDATARALRTIFADPGRFVVHAPLPAFLGDEGAANHTRLETSRGRAHLFAWGRRAWGEATGPRTFDARQTREASESLARLHALPASCCLFPQQRPDGIDAGAFHTDVLAVGAGSVFMFHERAFVDDASLEARLGQILGEELTLVRATERELPVANAVRAYPFNAQLLALDDGSVEIVAPEDALDDPPSRRFFERVVAIGAPIRAVHFVDVRQSMRNGGGPACLRLRVPLERDELASMGARVLLDDRLERELSSWIERRYRDRLAPDDLADPALARDSMEALDELTSILRLGSLYDFQRSASVRTLTSTSPEPEESYDAT